MKLQLNAFSAKILCSLFLLASCTPKSGEQKKEQNSSTTNSALDLLNPFLADVLAVWEENSSSAFVGEAFTYSEKTGDYRKKCAVTFMQNYFGDNTLEHGVSIEFGPNVPRLTLNSSIKMKKMNILKNQNEFDSLGFDATSFSGTFKIEIDKVKAMSFKRKSAYTSDNESYFIVYNAENNKFVTAGYKLQGADAVYCINIKDERKGSDN